MSRRRQLILASAAALGWPALLSSVRAQQRLAPTPAQTEGPFYPTDLQGDTDADLLRYGTLPYGHGQPLSLDGRVLDVSGRPVTGAVVEIWQCDHAGQYRHPAAGQRVDPAFQGFGRASVADDGRYAFRTILPVPYSGRTPHIHVKVKLGSRELLTTQLYVAGHPGNARDFLWQRLDSEARAALTRRFAPASHGASVAFPIVVNV